jgi:hypothetical protein
MVWNPVSYSPCAWHGILGMLLVVVTRAVHYDTIQVSKKEATKASSPLPIAFTDPSRHLLGRAHTQRSPVMDWIQHAKRLFNVPKPEHFTNSRHCCECAEHDETLLAQDVNSIGIEQRAFVAECLAYLIEQYSAELDGCAYAADILKAYDIWSV